MCRRNWAFHTRRKGSRPARRETRSDRGKDAIRLRNRRRPHSLRPRRQLLCDRTWHTTGRRSNSDFGLGSQPSCVASQGCTFQHLPVASYRTVAISNTHPHAPDAHGQSRRHQSRHRQPADDSVAFAIVRGSAGRGTYPPRAIAPAHKRSSSRYPHRPYVLYCRVVIPFHAGMPPFS